MISAINKHVYILGSIFFVASCITKGHGGKQKAIGYKALQEDFKILRKTLEEVHPGLYWYSDKQILDNYFDSTESLIKKDMTSGEFFKLLLPVIAKVKCGHTNIRLPDKSDKDPALFSHLLPFEFFCQDNKLYITKALNNAGYEGSEIMSINHRKTKEILSTLLNSLPADGYNETFKYHLLNQGAFREGYALFFEQPDSFTIETINTSSAKPAIFTVRAISPQQIIPAIRIAQPHFLLTFNHLTAVLAVNTFAISAGVFKDTLGIIFKAIKEKKVEHLIIDLRRNSGGADDNVSTLFSYIAFGPFLHVKRAEMNAAPISFSQFFRDPPIARKPQHNTAVDGKYLVNYRYAGASIKYPVKDNLYKGEVLLLTSGQTTSAASEFAALNHYLKRAKIIGEETGGCYYGATGGNYVNLKLPASGLEVQVPAIRIFTAVDEDSIHQPKGHGTIPDYLITPTINDILQKKDVRMDKALELTHE